MNDVEANDARQTPGPSAKSKGPGMILVAVYALFSLSAGARALYQILAKFDEAPVSFVLSGVAAARCRCTPAKNLSTGAAARAVGTYHPAQ